MGVWRTLFTGSTLHGGMRDTWGGGEGHFAWGDRGHWGGGGGGHFAAGYDGLFACYWSLKQSVNKQTQSLKTGG